MRQCASLVMLFLVCMMPVVNAAESDLSDTTILSLVLQRHYQDGGYSVVAPMTTLWTLTLRKPEDLSRSKGFAGVNIGVKGEDVQQLIKKLIEKLIDKNKKPVKLELKSSPKDGYLVDYDGKFEKYFAGEDVIMKKFLGARDVGWDKLYKENPQAHGKTSVSLPVHDKQSGLILVYKGTSSHWLMGEGSLILYKYIKGKLEEQGRVRLWVS